MHPDILHLEDKHHSSIDILSILNGNGEIVEDDEVLGVLHNFYVDLYRT